MALNATVPDPEPEPEPEPVPEQEPVLDEAESNGFSEQEDEPEPEVTESSSNDSNEPSDESEGEGTSEEQDQAEEVPYEELPDEHPTDDAIQPIPYSASPHAAPYGYQYGTLKENGTPMEKHDDANPNDLNEGLIEPYEELPDSREPAQNEGIFPPHEVRDNEVHLHEVQRSDEVYTAVAPVKGGPAVIPLGDGVTGMERERSTRKGQSNIIYVNSGSSDDEEAPPIPPHPDCADDVTLLMKDNWRMEMPVTFHIKVTDSSPRAFKVKVKSPTGTEQLLPVVRSDELMYDVAFTPEEAGTWMVDVTENNEHVTGSPHKVVVSDVSKAEIVRYYKGPVPVGEQTSFQVRTELVFNDKISVHIMHENVSIPVMLAPADHHMKKVTFTPEAVGNHYVSVYVGGAEVPGSPFTIMAESQGDIVVRGRGLRGGVEGQVSKFQLDTRQQRDRPLAVLITGPGGSNVEPDIEKVDDLVKVSYVPPEIGTYKIEVVYNNVPVMGSPFRLDVVAGKKLYVTGMPNETQRNQTYSFVVDAREMAKGTLEIDSDLPVLNYEKAGEKTYKVTFVPRKVGKHDIIIRYNKQVVADSPYVIMVT